MDGEQIELKLDISAFIREFLVPLNDDVPLLALLNTTFSLIAYVAGLNNVQVKSSLIHTQDRAVPANFYGVTFLPSGGGKDRMVSIIDENIIADIREDFKFRAKQDYKQKKEAVLRQAEEMFGEKDTVAKKDYIRENLPRHLVDRMSDATPEGLQDVRKAFMHAEWAGTFMQVGELSDFILSDRSDRKDLLSLMKEIWEFGNSEPKVIKGDKEPVRITRVPSSALMYSSIEGLQEGAGRERFMHFLNSGLARRCFLAYPEVKKYVAPTETIEERVRKKREQRENALSQAKRFRDHFWNAYKKTIKTATYGQNNIFTLDEEADQLLAEYQLICSDKVAQMASEGAESGLRSEIQNRWSKVLRLAGLFAFFDGSDEKRVTKSDVETAISFAEHTGTQIARFYKEEDPTADKLLSVFLNNVDNPLTKVEIRSYNIVTKNKFSQWFAQTLPFCKELAVDKGYVITEKQGEKNKQLYICTKIEDTTGEVGFTQADSNSTHDKNFKPTQTDFLKMHEVTGQDKSWSCVREFANNERSDDNVKGGLDMIALDVDEGMSLTEAKAIFEKNKIQALFSTTRSHQVSKNGKPACDRFRIVIPLKYRWVGNKSEFKSLMRGVVNKLGLKTDPSTVNISRLWFGNPTQAFGYTEGDKLDYFQYIEEPKKEIKKQIKSYSGGEKGISAMVRWFVQNYDKYGGRNNTLYIASQFFKNEKGLSAAECVLYVWQLNANFPEPLDEREVRATVLKSNGWS